MLSGPTCLCVFAVYADGRLQITVQKPAKEGQAERVDVDLEQTNCEVCGASDREDRLLLCDGCDAG